jgi:DnaK suppressor protein
MGEKIKKSKADSLNPAKSIDPKEKFRVLRKTLADMKENLLAEGRGKSLPDNLDVSLDIGDEGDRAGNESIRDVSILLSARNKEKLLAVEEALEKIREGTYGMCEECGEEIGGGRLKVMPLAKSCVTCQSRLEKETAHQKFAEGKLDHALIGEAEGEAME